MPFTAAHPALIVPLLRLHRRWLSVTGLIVGSIAPDFAYFLPVDRLGSLSHSLKGLLLFNLPMAFVLAILFHMLIRDQVMQQLPEYFRKRALAVQPVRVADLLLKNVHIFAISALIGSFTHLFWDSFTHYNGYFVRNYPFLQQPVSVLGILSLPLCRVLQHASTLAGFTVLLWHIHSLPVAPVKRRFLFAWLPYWVLVGFIAAVFMLLNLPSHFHLSGLERLVVPYLAGILLAVTGLATIRKVRLLFG
ncbi:DUF4184 family protein [Pontibacter sp. Tf4]|uniref:DUF4184 family protein n=1 Tax=Pontibacter sp. Tf4 TaxID=2761620 RepID=UPI00162A8970|nr:DUF4184 family protein [Pontibacter sp. Tf4]MBB6612267.1 DUF4184 family protein [Pontibacter sp. Tf4]